MPYSSIEVGSSILRRVHWLETPSSGQSAQRQHSPFNTRRNAPRYGPRVARGVPERDDRAHRLLREKRALAKRERKQYITGILFLTHPPPSPSDSPGGAGLRASDLFTANPNILGFGLLGDASQSAGEGCRTLREDGSILRCVHWMETPSSGQSVQR